MDSKSVADDRLEGAEAIAAFMGVEVRRARHLISAGRLPVGHEGRRLVASKAVLLEHWKSLTASDITRRGPDSQTAAR